MGVEYRHQGYAAAFGVLVFLLVSGAVNLHPVIAQTDDSPDRATQEKRASLEEEGQPPMGWVRVLEPIDIRSLSRPLTELERLSQSQSGAGFFSRSFYDVSEDNPLEPVSVTIRALNKITAQFTDMEINIGALVTFGTVAILPRVCDKNPPEEFPEISAFLEISSTKDDALLVKNTDLRLVNASRGILRSTGVVVDKEDSMTSAAENTPEVPEAESTIPTVDRIEGGDHLGATSWSRVPKNTIQEMAFAKLPALFKGWMFASSPALNALEHPVYDVWVIDCKMVELVL